MCNVVGKQTWARMFRRDLSATEPSLVERMDLWLSKGHVVDGIWVGSFPSDAKPAIQRIVASETTTVEWIASAIVHEATHARLEKLGIRYDEAVRQRIERICARRELDFARHLSGVDALLEEITWRLDRCSEENASYTDQNMWEKTDQGNAEILRHLGTPEWVITLVLRARNLVSGIRRFTRRIAGASIQ